MTGMVDIEGNERPRDDAPRWQHGDAGDNVTASVPTWERDAGAQDPNALTEKRRWQQRRHRTAR
eukprot:14452226-Heterocapsa_arctica.AAC.1